MCGGDGAWRWGVVMGIERWGGGVELLEKVGN